MACLFLGVKYEMKNLFFGRLEACWEEIWKSDPIHIFHKLVKDLVLTTLFDVFFKQKDHHGQDKWPGVLSKIANHLPSGFEKQACDLADLPEHHWTELHAYFFETIPQSLTSGFQSLCDRAHNYPNCDWDVTVMPWFWKCFWFFPREFLLPEPLWLVFQKARCSHLWWAPGLLCFGATAHLLALLVNPTARFEGCPIYPHCNGPFIDITVRSVRMVRIGFWPSVRQSLRSVNCISLSTLIILCCFALMFLEGLNSVCTVHQGFYGP